MSQQQTILIVEDSPVNRKILSEMLIRNGHTILTAVSGETAVSLTEKVQPDLIILDIMLPGMDGYATCAQLKNKAATADIPIIFISALDATEDKLGGFKAGGVDYITKPFQPAEVLARIHTHLRLCHLQRKLEEQNRQLEVEKQKSEALLRNVLPRRISMELMETGSCVPQLFPETTVCFADIVDFTAASALLPPERIIKELNDIFTGFDKIILDNSCERMKTIGDAYLFVCGIPETNDRHAHQVALSALAMVDFLQQRNRTSEQTWTIRIGMHSGPVVGGVVGTEKYLYDIFGDTVNIAARMEELGQPMEVNVSSASFDLLQDHFLFHDRKKLEIKGKGKQTMYTLGKKKSHV